MGAEKISFTDHAPFPGNPFGNRMDIEQLDEYLSTLKALRKKYFEQIKIEIGLEAEYIPAFKYYYKTLLKDKKLDYLVLGQHMFFDGIDYSFSWTAEKKNAEEHTGLVNSMIEGIETGFFKYVAHPDRAFRRLKVWTPQAEEVSKKLIEAAVKAQIPLEKNLSSMEKPHNFRPEFWSLVPENHPVIYGVDAHSTVELERIAKKIN